MNIAWLIAPVLIQILLSIVLYIQLAAVKFRAVKAGDADRKRTALHADGWPDYVLKVNNNIRNQFETPVLFYVLVVMAIVLGVVNTWSAIFAWAFVVSRLVHAYIHTSNNVVRHRLRAFTLGIVALVGLLAVCGIEVATRLV